MSYDNAGTKKLPPKGWKSVSRMRKEQEYQDRIELFQRIENLESRLLDFERKPLHPTRLEELKDLRKQCIWQAQMLKRAKVMICVGQDDERWPMAEQSWLADLEKGSNG